jgi:hypothetical protein
MRVPERERQHEACDGETCLARICGALGVATLPSTPVMGKPVWHESVERWEW